MGNSVFRVIVLGVVVVGGWVGLYHFERHLSGDAKLDEERAKTRAAEARVEQLTQVVQHLGSEQRVADIIVLNQTDYGAAMHTTLLFQEYAKDGLPIPPKTFTIEGNEAHFDAMVIKFQGKYVQDKDPLRGRSIALFTKLFDNKSAPDQGQPIDDPNHIPTIYKGADPKVGEFEQQLWRDFWQLAKDAKYRNEMGVDVIQGKSVWWRFEPNFLYTLTLQADADLNLRWKPLEPIWKEMLRRYQGTPSNPATRPAGPLLD